MIPYIIADRDMMLIRVYHLLSSSIADYNMMLICVLSRAPFSIADEGVITCSPQALLSMT